MLGCARFGKSTPAQDAQNRATLAKPADGNPFHPSPSSRGWGERDELQPPCDGFRLDPEPRQAVLLASPAMLN